MIINIVLANTFITPHNFQHVTLLSIHHLILLGEHLRYSFLATLMYVIQVLAILTMLCIRPLELSF